MNKKILFNIAFGIWYISLYDFWLYLFTVELIGGALVIATSVAFNCAVFFNNNKRRFVSFGICLAVYAIQLGLFSLQRHRIINSILLPGLDKISYEWLGNLTYFCIILVNAFFALCLLLVSFIIPQITSACISKILTLKDNANRPLNEQITSDVPRKANSKQRR